MKALMLLMSNFINVVTENEIPEVNPSDELESVRAMETAYQSLLTGQYLSIHPVLTDVGTSPEERKFSVFSSGKVSYPA